MLELFLKGGSLEVTCKGDDIDSTSLPVPARWCRRVSCPIRPLALAAYTPGFNATNSGIMPEPGLTYANYFMDYSFSQLQCPTCGLASDFNTAVFADVNVFVWVSKKKVLGANYGLVAGLPFSNSAISLAGLGPVGGGGGFADSFYQPLSLGWHTKRADIQAAYAFFAPTGRYTAGASNNTGSGHWTNAPTVGETFYLTKNKATSFSAYQMYEFHTTQSGTDIHAGQTFDLDYSLMQILPLKKNMETLLQFGVVGYGQYQTSDNSGPGVNPAVPGHYRVNAIGGQLTSSCRSERPAWALRHSRNFRTRSRSMGTPCRSWARSRFRRSEVRLPGSSG